MKKSLTLLLASLMLVFSLTACGGSEDNTQQNDSANQNDSAVIGGENAGNGENGSSNGNSGGSENDSNGSSGNGSQNGSNGGSGNGSQNGSSAGSGDGSNGSGNGQGGNSGTNGNDSLMEDAKDALDGTAKQNTTGGVSYEQMLRNARVHDKDGDLTDLENSVTPGNAF